MVKHGSPPATRRMVGLIHGFKSTPLLILTPGWTKLGSISISDPTPGFAALSTGWSADEWLIMFISGECKRLLD